MASSRVQRIKRIETILLSGLLIFFLAGWAIFIPEKRTYPEREPVIFWHMWTSGWKEIIEEICVAFNESQTEYEVIPLSIPAGVANSKFLLSVAGGSPPDCMAQWNPIVPQFAESDAIQPIDTLMTPEELTRFEQEAFPVAKKMAMYNGRPYCMPLAIDIRALFFRLDHLHAAGLIPDSAPEQVTTRNEFQQIKAVLPDTLEELTEWGRQLHVFDSKGRIARLGFIPQSFKLLAPVFGGGLYDWEEEQLTIDTPNNLKALTYITDQHKILGFERMLRFQTSLTGKHGADWPFAIGKKSITIDGQWRVRQLERYAPDLPYMTAPIPPPAEGGKANAGWVHGNYMIFPKGASNPDGAWAFVKFWTGMDNAERSALFYTRAGWLPTSPRIAETKMFRKYLRKHPQFQTFIDLLDSPNMDPTPPVPFQLLLFDSLREVDESASRGSLTPTKALETLENLIADEIARHERGER